jgi:hypothetical protein
MLRVIEIDPLSLERQTLTASRVVGEEAACSGSAFQTAAPRSEAVVLVIAMCVLLSGRGQRARLLPDVTAPPRGVYLVA